MEEGHAQYQGADDCQIRGRWAGSRGLAFESSARVGRGHGPAAAPADAKLGGSAHGRPTRRKGSGLSDRCRRRG
jgi:hypothetical protein